MYGSGDKLTGVGWNPIDPHVFHFYAGGKMKSVKIYRAVVFFILAGLTVSCVSLQDRILTANERETIQSVGTVSTTWVSWQWFHIQNPVKQKAYTKLLNLARIRYSGNIDVKNVIANGSFAPIELVPAIFYPASILGNFQKITATGEVVLLSGTVQRRTEKTTVLERVTGQAINSMVPQVPERSTVAVLSIAAPDSGQAVLVIEELEYLLVAMGKYRVVDRNTLDLIRREQNFQMTGEVSDESAVSIGKLLGANIVFTGTITGSGGAQRLTLKALNVQTGEIVAMAREQL
jgi:hypothetical protein